MIQISLVVCTRNRAQRLAAALPYFAALKTGASWEMILVDNGSTDDTPHILGEFARGSGVDCTLVHEPRIGVSAGRNAGWRRAAGSLVAFTDDDCYPAPDYLDEIGRCFSEASLGYVGGRVLLFDRNDYPITIQVSEQRVDIAPRSFVQPGLLHGANCAFRRSVLETVGGFDEKLGPGTRLQGAEDLDILARASACGFPGAYDPGPVVFHHHRRSTAEDVNFLMAAYDVGRGAYYAKSLMDPRMRWSYLWPALRRIGGNTWRREFAVMRREFQGAWTYIHG